MSFSSLPASWPSTPQASFSHANLEKGTSRLNVAFTLLASSPDFPAT